MKRVLADLLELIRAAAALAMAKLRAPGADCPPHDIPDGWLFCRRCGHYYAEDER